MAYSGKQRRSAHRVLVGLAGASALLLAACAGPAQDTQPDSAASVVQAAAASPAPSSSSGTPTASADASSAAPTTPTDELVPGQEVPVSAVLAALPMEPEQAQGYDRDLFEHWTDSDSDSCDAREEVLIAEATGTVTTGSGCRVTSGSWLSVYDQVTVAAAGDLDIDHMVPLAEAWRSGAWSWDADTRQRYANDLGHPFSLIAVTASTNRSKSDSDPADWMPPAVGYQCTYATQWVVVKHRWSLAVDPREQTALQSTIQDCGDPVVTVPEPARIQQGSSPEADASAPAGDAPAGADGPTDPRYASCSKAIAAGYGPYVQGIDEEYGWYRDGDSDGTVCE